MPLIVFLLWDYVFTMLVVWGFNHKYVMGVYVGGLPIEEILFFVCIPFSCIFIYEVVRYYYKRDIFGKKAHWITLIFLNYLQVSRISFSYYLVRLFMKILPEIL